MSLLIVATLVAGFVLASEIVLTLFLAVLFGVFLRRLTDTVGRWLPITQGWSIALVVVMIFLFIVATVSLFYVQVNERLESADQQLNAGLLKLEELVDGSPTARSIVASIPFLSDVMEQPSETTTASEPDAEAGPTSEAQNQAIPGMKAMPEPVKRAARRVVRSIGQLFKTTFGLVINSLLIFFVGLFLALSPHTYRDGIVKLVGPSKRVRFTDVLDEIGDVLWRWLLGRLGSMLATGLGAALLLWLIGVPMAGSLGIATGLLTFIPNIGAAIALSLSVVFALPEGATTAASVLPAYLGLQFLESYILTPLIQKRQVSIPPAALIAFQAIMGVVFGMLGAAVASPLLAALKTAVERLYIEDVLEASQ